MTTDELRTLPIGTKLIYIYEPSGGTEERHAAKVVEQASYYTGVLIYFASKQQAKRRWSHATNRPVGERAHLGRVQLIRA